MDPDHPACEAPTSKGQVQRTRGRWQRVERETRRHGSCRVGCCGDVGGEDGPCVHWLWS